MTVCKKCGGSGWDDEHMIKCLHCHGSGEVEMTNEEWMRSATFEELAGAIYEWHSAGYTSGRVGLGLNPVTEVVEWLKKPYSPK